MKKQIIENAMVVNVLDKPHKETGKVYPKLILCDDYGHAERVGIKLDQVAKFKALRGHVVNAVLAVWAKKTADGKPFDTYELDSYEEVKVARAA